MAKSSDAQKFIGQRRAPRVQIEYDVEEYGSQKKVELPFVAGVMADLSGDNTESLSPVDERRFTEIDIDNFDAKMAAIAPSIHYHVRNVLADDGTLIPIDLSFDSMESFEPAQVVNRIPELSTLLEARNQLKELLTYMDGKVAAEEIVERLLKDPRRSAENGTDPDAQIKAESTDMGNSDPEGAI